MNTVRIGTLSVIAAFAIGVLVIAPVATGHSESGARASSTGTPPQG
jgi:hypothetical protein